MQTPTAMAMTPLETLNFALTLEHLEHALYRDGLKTFGPDAFAARGYAANVRDYFSMIRDHEQAHVDALTKTIADLGGEPVAEGAYDFRFRDLEGFFATAGELENTGVSAYEGAAKFLIDADDLLTVALTIHGVEARHAAYIDGLIGNSPFPEAFDPPLAPDTVLAIAEAFSRA
jgi:rubrerythrin